MTKKLKIIAVTYVCVASDSVKAESVRYTYVTLLANVLIHEHQ